MDIYLRHALRVLRDPCNTFCVPRAISILRASCHIHRASCLYHASQRGSQRALKSTMNVALYISRRGSFAFTMGLLTSAALRAINRLRSGTRAPPKELKVTSPKTSQTFTIRRLRASDEHKGFLALLAQLTTVGHGDFKRRFREISDGPEYVYVIEDDGAVVASGTLVLERKFTRSCGTCGHIEDVVVDANVRGKDLGRVLIEGLTLAAERANCYKAILDCSEANAGFYEKCGYARKELQMARYFVKP
jgi:glucosamine-phosphate N-acetyltransferase